MSRLPVRTHHCRFCNHLLLATTRDIASLPRRKEPAKDAAIILPLPVEPPEEADPAEEPVKEETGEKELEEASSATDKPNNDENTHRDPAQTSRSDQAPSQAQNQGQSHYTILLSTTIPDRKPTLVRREDGFEKRLLLRCGRCRIVVGYFLDPVHFPTTQPSQPKDEGEEDRAKVVYLLPGAVVETDQMGDDATGKAMDGEWRAWSS